jgi:hypothetical protein
MPLVIGFGLFGFWLLCGGIGGIWRLVDRRPAIAADPVGVRFHPSICARSIPWNEVRYIQDVEGRPAQIRVGITRRFWSPFAWASATSIRLNRIAVGLSETQAREVVQKLKDFAPDQFEVHHRAPT